MSAPTIEQPEGAPGALERLEMRLKRPEQEHEVPVSPAREPLGLRLGAIAAPVELPPIVRVQKTPIREAIEEALADESLRRIYGTLPAGTQALFRERSEALAVRLEELVARASFDLDAAHEAIVKWLRVLPQTNPYFLTQEAKVKTDRIVLLARKSRK